MPRHLQAIIHADFSSGSGNWTGYRDQIVSMYNSSPTGSKGDFNDHLIREYNRKIYKLGQPIELYITPWDAGFRFKGTGVS